MSSTAAALTKVTQLTVRVENGPTRGQAHQLQKSPIFIGRDADNDIVFAQDIKMSRRHVQISFESGKWVIKNLSQKNSIRINGQETQQATLNGATKIEVGETELVVAMPEGAPQLSVAPSAGVVAAAGASAPAPRKPAMAPGAPGARPSAKRPQAAPLPKAGAPPKNLRIFLIVGILALGAVYFISNPNRIAAKKATERVSDKTLLDIEKSQEITQDLRKKERSAQENVRYELAQEQYVKGFRDYRQGQYARAMVAFNAALGLYPTHELAKKYYYISKRKFDEVAQAHMLQGKRYRGINNYRMCKSSYGSVMIMLKDANDPVYKEAKQFYDECSLKLGDKY